jgi:hypothetical protein
MVTVVLAGEKSLPSGLLVCGGKSCAVAGVEVKIGAVATAIRLKAAMRDAVDWWREERIIKGGIPD